MSGKFNLSILCLALLFSFKLNSQQEISSSLTSSLIRENPLSYLQRYIYDGDISGVKSILNYLEQLETSHRPDMLGRMPPLHVAIILTSQRQMSHNHAKILQLVIDYYIKHHIKIWGHGPVLSRALHLAIEHNNISALRYMLAYPISPTVFNRRNLANLTPLENARQCRNINAIDALVNFQERRAFESIFSIFHLTLISMLYLSAISVKSRL